VGGTLTQFCSNSIPWRSARGANAAERYEERHQCSDKLSMLAAHARIAPDIGRENQWRVWCTERPVSWPSKSPGLGRTGMLGRARWVGIEACCRATRCPEDLFDGFCRVWCGHCPDGSGSIARIGRRMARISSFCRRASSKSKTC
jgi:hypothetical protein